MPLRSVAVVDVKVRQGSENGCMTRDSAFWVTYTCRLQSCLMSRRNCLKFGEITVSTG